MNAGLYFHIPYCVKKCDYCDFYSVHRTDGQKIYFEAVRKEMEVYRGKRIAVDSVFFGGGTPSVADPMELAALLEQAREIFSFSSDTEITIELNPKTFHREKLLIYCNSGVNRISMGLQSANNDELSKLGRIHTKEEFLSSYELLREVGFSNINTDIIYGLPDSDLHSLERTLSFLRELDCEHISAYALTLNDNSPMYRRGYRFPDDDGVYEQYRLVCEMLSDYRHYEISNFVKQSESPCRHNLKYWQRVPYLGFGAAAHSFFEGCRWSNPEDIHCYVQGIQQEIQPEKEKVLQEDSFVETMMLSLRTDKGVMYADLPQGFYEKNRKLLEQFEASGYLTMGENGFRLTEAGFFVSNSILTALL